MTAALRRNFLFHDRAFGAVISRLRVTLKTEVSSLLLSCYLRKTSVFPYLPSLSLSLSIFSLSLSLCVCVCVCVCVSLSLLLGVVCKRQTCVNDVDSL